MGLRSVFSIAGFGLPVISFLARLPAAICPIGTLLMLTELNGIGRAGIAAGMLWTGQALAGPPLGRLADRVGHRTVILTASVVNALAIAALVAAVLVGLPAVVEAVLAAAVGLSVPQIGPLSRTRWIVLTGASASDGGGGGTELTGRALSFDTTVDEISFMVGPALAGLAVVCVHPVAGLLLAGLLIAVFGVLFATHPTAPPGTGPRTAAAVPLLSPALAVLFAMALLQGMIWGSANAGVSALAQQLGNPGMAGFTWGAMAVTSALAGIAVTLRPGRADRTVLLRSAIVAQAVLLLPLLAVHGLLGATAVIAAIGLAVAPHLIAVFSLAERAAPLERMGEAMALLGSGLIAGQGIAALAAGQVAEHAGSHGYRVAFALSCASGALAVLTALTLVRRRAFAPREVITA